MMKESKEIVHLAVDNIVLDLIVDYHNLTHSEVVSYFNELANETIKYDGNIANAVKYPKLMFHKKGKAIYKTETRPVAVTAPPRHPGFYSMPVEEPCPHIWVVRGFYPQTKIPFKLSVVLHDNDFNKNYLSKVTLGDKTKISRFVTPDIEKYQQETADAILLDKDIKKLEPIPYTRKTFRCMKPKGMALLSKSK